MYGWLTGWLSRACDPWTLGHEFKPHIGHGRYFKKKSIHCIYESFFNLIFFCPSIPISINLRKVNMESKLKHFENYLKHLKLTICRNNHHSRVFQFNYFIEICYKPSTANCSLLYSPNVQYSIGYTMIHNHNLKIILSFIP